MYEEHCRSYGLDPEELLQGNKPRYTMGDDGEIKDHETGKVYGAPVQEAAAVQDPSARPAEPGAASGLGGIVLERPVQNVGHADDARGVTAAVPGCDHAFPEPVEASTACTVCGTTFETWANQ